MNLLETIVTGKTTEYVEMLKEEWLKNLLEAAKLKSPSRVVLGCIPNTKRYSILVNNMYIESRFTHVFAERRQKEISKILIRNGFTVI